MSKTDRKKKYGINVDETTDPQTEVLNLEGKKQEIRILELKN